jgi:hypothetical protein
MTLVKEELDESAIIQPGMMSAKQKRQPGKTTG